MTLYDFYTIEKDIHFGQQDMTIQQAVDYAQKHRLYYEKVKK
jgi:hypothetical protein